MKTKSWFIIAIIVCGLAPFLTGCLDGGTNQQTYEYIPSRVDMTMAGTMLSTNIPGLYSPIYAPALDAQMLYSGDYIVASYTINFDEQSEGSKYYKANVFDYLPAPLSYLDFSDELPKSDIYKDTIVAVEPWGTFSLEDGIGIQLMDDRTAFFYTEEKDAKTSIFECRMICSKDSIKDGIPRIYLQAAKSARGSKYNSPFRTFDMSQLMNSSYAKEKTIGGVNYNAVKTNLFYQIDTDKESGKPLFKEYAKNPLYIVNPISQQ